MTHEDGFRYAKSICELFPQMMVKKELKIKVKNRLKLLLKFPLVSNTLVKKNFEKEWLKSLLMKDEDAVRAFERRIREKMRPEEQYISTQTTQRSNVGASRSGLTNAGRAMNQVKLNVGDKPRSASSNQAHQFKREQAAQASHDRESVKRGPGGSEMQRRLDSKSQPPLKPSERRALMDKQSQEDRLSKLRGDRPKDDKIRASALAVQQKIAREEAKLERENMSAAKVVDSAYNIKKKGKTVSQYDPAAVNYDTGYGASFEDNAYMPDDFPAPAVEEEYVPKPAVKTDRERRIEKIDNNKVIKKYEREEPVRKPERSYASQEVPRRADRDDLSRRSDYDDRRSERGVTRAPVPQAPKEPEIPLGTILNVSYCN